MRILSTIYPDPECSSNLFFRFAFRLCKLLLQVQVGRIEIYGEENIQITDNPLMICANHPHYVDTMILGIALRRPARVMAHQQVFRFGFGVGKFIFKKLGAFSAGNGTRSGAQQACKTAVDALKSGEVLIMLPEGEISFSSTIHKFRSGAVRITNEVSNQLGKSAYVVPAYIKYGRYPGRWIHRIPGSGMQGFLLLLGFFYYRRGATLIFGNPISSEELPRRSRIASNFLLSQVAELGNFKLENVRDGSMINALS